MTKCFYDLLDKLKIGIVLLDRRHRVIFWNDWMSKKTELSADSVLSMPIEDLSSKFASSRYSKYIRYYIRNGAVAIFIRCSSWHFFSECRISTRLWNKAESTNRKGRWAYASNSGWRFKRTLYEGKANEEIYRALGKGKWWN